MAEVESNKFSLVQATNNNNGKTSGSGVAGIVLIFTGCICFILAMIGWMFMKLPDATSAVSYTHLTLPTKRIV